MKGIRKKLSLTQQQLADLISVSQPTVAAWEGGSRTPTVAAAKRLVTLCKSKGVGLTLEEIYINQ